MEMVNRVLNIIKSKDLIIPKILFINYRKLNITEGELILLIYFINLNSNLFNINAIVEELDLSKEEVLKLIDSLSSKGLLKIVVNKKEKKITEEISIDGLYDKLSFLVVDAKETKNNLYDVFESKLGRTLSPTEYELINGFTSMYSEELITLAIDEAVYNGVNNLRYIDRILYEWNKKGIKNKDDLKRARVARKENNQKLFDYDWLNEKDE